MLATILPREPQMHHQHIQSTLLEKEKRMYSIE